MQTKKCDCPEICKTCTGVQPKDSFNWKKISNISINRFLSKFEDEVIYIIQTGFQDKFVVLNESAHNEITEKIFEGTKIEVEEKFEIKISETPETHKTECAHDYSDGTGTGWTICKKCGDMY